MNQIVTLYQGIQKDKTFKELYKLAEKGKNVAFGIASDHKITTLIKEEKITQLLVKICKSG